MMAPRCASSPLRGATTVAVNESPAILDGTEELMREIMARNEIGPDDVVSCIFTSPTTST
jgi:chorismate mutase